MKSKYIISVLFVVIGLSFISIYLITKSKASDPVVIYADSLFEELSIDEKIARAEIIVLGEVVSNLPSKWKYENDKDVRHASHQEIFDAEGLFTDSLFRVDSIFKGEIKDPLIRVRSFVGETDQLSWKNDSQPLYLKGKAYLLFLQQDTGPTSKVDPGNYISINSVNAVYEIVDGRAVSADDEWLLDDLIDYIEKSLSGDVLPVDTVIGMPTITP